MLGEAEQELVADAPVLVEVDALRDVGSVDSIGDDVGHHSDYDVLFNVERASGSVIR